VPSLASPDRHVSWRRLLFGGLLAAALAGLAGAVLERAWFGASDQAAAVRVESMVRREFDVMSRTLVRVATTIANDPATAGLGSGPEATRALFDSLANARDTSPNPDDVAVTVYDLADVARAWSGRPSEISRDRTSGAQNLFVQRSALGMRLVHVHPIVGAEGRRLGAIAAEHVLSRTTAGAAIESGNEPLATAIAPVQFLLPAEGGGVKIAPGSFLLESQNGTPLVQASVSSADLQEARHEWRRTVIGWVLVILGVTMLLLIGPLLDARLSVTTSRAFVASTAAASLLLLAGAVAIWFGIASATSGRLNLVASLAFVGVGLASLAALWTTPAVRLEAAYRAQRPSAGERTAGFVATQVLAGVVVAGLLLLFTYVLAAIVDRSMMDVRQFSLYPWNGARLLRLGGTLALQFAALWLSTLTLVVARGAWRLRRRSPGSRLLLLSLWLAPTAIALVAAASRGVSLPVFGVLLSAVACGITALLSSRVFNWYRHATVASRIFGLFLVFLVPTVLLYPLVDFFAERAVERVITHEYAVEAQTHPQVLLERLRETQGEIDKMSGLPDLVTDAAGDPGGPPAIDGAFSVWRQTALARDRLTSAVELYDGNGKLVSPFALYLPEYTGSRQQGGPVKPRCEWDVFGEPLPIGSDERPVLHAERGICVADGNGGQRSIGAIVVHVALDFRTLPFVTSQSPYFELFRGALRTPSLGNDFHVAIYGWGLQPLYTSGLSAWPIESLFERIYDSERRPFWETIPLGGSTYRVYITNDRARIYAIGYRLLTPFDHLVHLAEVTTLAGAAFGLVLLGTAVFTRLSRAQPRVGRALLREIRASFYRKLFLAFVLASIIPVLTLALFIRTYFAGLLRNDIQAEAARTASVARRVIEESDALLRRGAEGVDPVNDDVLIWLQQVIAQDVNIFDGPELVATSERDLFQSGLLPTRTPDGVFRSIALQRLPSFVDEDQIGTFPYLIAATPVRVRSIDYILTVPLAARQQEIERQKYDLDRGVHLAVVFFILLGAAIGLSLAERIADPVRRLTRATQRIGRGDFDARIAVRSVDELRRLVDAFNSMAGELKSQRVELERTHRLEAWAEMARQVAHEIKNPLTPIQLSAEHLQRVHADQGKPLGPVLEGCIDTILGQVRLLRQIAAEFSSFASSPKVKMAAVDVPELVAEIVNPYRAGLSDRIEIVNRVTGPLPEIKVDRTLVLRALANVVENALHAMPGQGTLVVDAASSGDTVTITVQDTGVGMDEEALARVFEPYFSTKTSGTGLGLPIARRNVELNGGTIDVHSRKGEGTTVRVSLPALRES
jgi:signal transduction histidine kinase